MPPPASRHPSKSFCFCDVLCRSVFRFWWDCGAEKGCLIVFKGFFLCFSLDLALFFLLSSVEIWEDESERLRKPICRAEAPDWDGDFCIEGWRQRTYRSSPCLSNFSLFWWWPRTSCYISFISSSRTTIGFVRGFLFELVNGSSTCDFFFLFSWSFWFCHDLNWILGCHKGPSFGLTWIKVGGFRCSIEFKK